MLPLLFSTGCGIRGFKDRHGVPWVSKSATGHLIQAAPVSSACKLDAMRRGLIVFLFALTAASSSSAQNAESSTNGFKWLDSAKDVTLFQQIKTAFSEDLKPDDPEKVKPVVAQLYKRISRIGVYQSSALVVILERETAASTDGDYFQPFNYDLKTGKKEALDKGFDFWRFNKFVRFEPSKIPDVVFTYWSCTECEAEHLLGSFRFDSAIGKWKLRSWGDRDIDDSILIGDDGKSLGEEGERNDDCLFGFDDFTGDGFDDVAVRCLAIDQNHRIVDDTTTIYAVRNGRPRVIAVKDPTKLVTIRKTLCAGIKKSKLCPPK